MRKGFDSIFFKRLSFKAIILILLIIALILNYGCAKPEVKDDPVETTEIGVEEQTELSAEQPSSNDESEQPSTSENILPPETLEYIDFTGNEDYLIPLKTLYQGLNDNNIELYFSAFTEATPENLSLVKDYLGQYTATNDEPYHENYYPLHDTLFDSDLRQLGFALDDFEEDYFRPYSGYDITSVQAKYGEELKQFERDNDIMIGTYSEAYLVRYIAHSPSFSLSRYESLYHEPPANDDYNWNDVIITDYFLPKAAIIVKADDEYKILNNYDESILASNIEYDCIEALIDFQSRLLSTSSIEDFYELLPDGYKEAFFKKVGYSDDLYETIKSYFSEYDPESPTADLHQNHTGWITFDSYQFPCLGFRIGNIIHVSGTLKPAEDLYGEKFTELPNTKETYLVEIVSIGGGGENTSNYVLICPIEDTYRVVWIV